MQWQRGLFAESVLCRDWQVHMTYAAGAGLHRVCGSERLNLLRARRSLSQADARLSRISSAGSVLPSSNSRNAPPPVEI